MKSKSKRSFKRLSKWGKILILFVIGLFIGSAISESSHCSERSFVVHSEEFGDDIARTIERQIEDRIEHRIEDRIVNEIIIPPLPDIPEMPDIPDFSDVHPNVHFDRTPSFWEVLDGIGTILASLILIGMGGMLLMRWRQPKEKRPESGEA